MFGFFDGGAMRYAILITGVLLAATSSEVRAQKDQVFEHLDELGRMNEKLQERNLRLERENRELRDRLRQYEALEPQEPAPPPPPPPAAQSTSPPRTEPSAAKPAPFRIPTLALPQFLLPSPSPSPSPTMVTGVLAIESVPKGAEVSTSLGAGCKTPCELEITTDQPFSIMLAHSGYEATTVDVQIANAQFTPNPISVQLRPAAQRKPGAQAPGKPFSLRP